VNRGLVAEVDLSAVTHNLKVLRRITGGRPVIAVVKADAYGHGSVEVSRRLQTEGVSLFAVAFAGEGKLLRDSGIDAGIIVLFDRFDPADYFSYKLTPVIQDMTTASAFSEEARARGAVIPVHVKIDTGMGRVGFDPADAVSCAMRIASMEGLYLEGLMSHFSEADLCDRSYALHQLAIFNEVRQGITEKLGRPILAHMANSAAVLSLPEALLDAVRPGLFIYGYSPFKEDHGLVPLMTVKTRIIAVRGLSAGSPVSYGRTFVTKRDSKIAVIASGYADGYDRHFSNNGEMLVRGKRVPVVGRVCMDLTMVDVTDVGGVSEGDEVVIMGRQGDAIITAGELASRINTIAYDIVTGIGGRARKVYSG